MLDHSAGLVICRFLDYGITLAFQLSDLGEYEFEPAQQPFDLGKGVRWQWFAQSGAEIRKSTPPILEEWSVAIDAQCRQDGADPIGQADALGDQFCSLAERPLRDGLIIA